MQEPLQKRKRYDPSLQNKEKLTNSESITDVDSRSDSETNTSTDSKRMWSNTGISDKDEDPDR